MNSKDRKKDWNKTNQISFRRHREVNYKTKQENKNTCRTQDFGKILFFSSIYSVL